MTVHDGRRDRIAALAEPAARRLLDGVLRSQTASAIVDTVVRAIFPAVCAGCGTSGYWLCPLCDQLERRIDLATVCGRCGRPSASTSQACARCDDWGAALVACRSAYLFETSVRTMIHRLKYRGEHARAEWCGTELAQLMTELGWQPDLLVPVPLHRTRMRTRGYNQSARMARVASTALDVPWGNVLTRTRATASQVGLDAVRRRENVNGAFACSHDLTDLAIVLVDDVVTTGATLEGCAEACCAAGEQDVRALTLATGT